MVSPDSNRYKIIRKIATGGMGELFLAHLHGDNGFERQVVIKRLHKELEGQEIYKDFFVQEARLSGKFHHPNIVQVYDMGHDSEGLYMVMEYIIGKDLMSLVRKSISNKEFIPLPHALNIILQIGEGLGYVHNLQSDRGKLLGLVHRDVTPQNIIVTLDGFAKLVDFGVASVSGENTSPGEGIIPGKINYMAPELLDGAPPDRRADIFSLGVMLFELTCGKRLFKGTKSDVKELIRRGHYTKPTSIKPDMDPALEQIILRSLEHDPDLRFQSARAMVEAIEKYALDRKLSLSRSSLSHYVIETFSVDTQIQFMPEESLERDEIPINLDVKFLEEWNDEGAVGAEMPEHDLSELDDDAYFELMADPVKFAEYLKSMDAEGDEESSGGHESKETPPPVEPDTAGDGIEPGSHEPARASAPAPAKKKSNKAARARKQAKTTKRSPKGSRVPIGLILFALALTLAIGAALGYMAGR